jgi:hypothetical protein
MGGSPTRLGNDQYGGASHAPGLGGSRTVTFRLSGIEFDAVERAVRSSGARSLSAFARAAVLEQVRALQAPAVTLSGDLTTLSRALTEVDNALQDASKRIRRVLGSGRAGAEETEADRG